MKDDYRGLFQPTVGASCRSDIAHLCVRHSSAGAHAKMMSESMAPVNDAGHVKDAVLTAAKE